MSREPQRLARSSRVARSRAATSLALLFFAASGRDARAQSTTTAAPLAGSPSPSDAAPMEISVRGVPRARQPVAESMTAAEAGRAAGAEGDPAKAVLDLAGVGRSSFESGQLIVWGAAPEDTRVSVDGVEVPRLFHGSALRSTVNGDLLQRVTLSPGAYDASYGRSLGGLVRLETKDLPASGLHGALAADPLDGSAFASAALGERVRVAIAGRYGWLDAVLRSVDAPDIGEFFAIPRYDDYQAKAQFALRDGESLDVVVLGSGDALTRSIPDVDPARVRTETDQDDFERVYARYRRHSSDGAEVDVVPWVGRDASRVDERFGATPASLAETDLRWGLRGSRRSRAAPWLVLDVGLDVDATQAHLARAGSLTIPAREGDVTVFGQPPGSAVNADVWDASTVDLAPYVQAEAAADVWSVAAGLRLDAYLLEASRGTPRVGQTPAIGLSHVDGEVEPRLSARLRLSRRETLFAAAGLYSQPPAPADRSAVFGTPALGPELAEHVAAGQALEIASGLSLEMTGFYKWMSDLVVRDPSPTPKLAEALLQDGVGRSYGVQLVVRQRPWHGLSGWAAYTLSRSERRDAPGVAWRLFDFDQPHVLTVVASQDLDDWTVGLRVRFARGLPRTPVVGALVDLEDDVSQPIFGAQNSIRLPDFWQVDLRVDRRFRLGGAARLTTYVEALNVTDHANAEEFAYSADYSRRGVITGLPFLALVGARLER